MSCPAATVRVRTAQDLQNAFDGARPGVSIYLENGLYHGRFTLKAKGTSQQPIYICGSRDAILDGGGIAPPGVPSDNGSGTSGSGTTVASGPGPGPGHYGLHLDSAEYVVISGFTIRNSQKGLVADRTTHSIFENLLVHDIGDEAIHLRAFSSDNIVQNSLVYRTGLRRAQYGEGIYIGSAISNWANYSGGKPDRSDRNIVRNNVIFATGAESVDIKEGTTDGQLLNNVFDGTGMSGSHADSWVDVKGNKWLIKGNVGFNSRLDGFQTHMISADWGDHNTFTENTAHVNGPGMGFTFHGQLANVLSCDNVVTGAAQGLSKEACQK